MRGSEAEVPYQTPTSNLTDEPLLAYLDQEEGGWRKGQDLSAARVYPGPPAKELR
jgi:hypothetical protein